MDRQQISIKATQSLLSAFRRVTTISHWFSRRLTHAGALIVGTMIAAAGFGVDTRVSLAYVLFSVAFSLLMVGFIARGRIRPKLELTRWLPKFVTVGTPVRYTISIKNTSSYLLAGFTLEERLRQQYPTAVEFISRRHSGNMTRASNRFDRIIGYPDWVEWLRDLRAVEIKTVSIPTLRSGQSTNIELELQPRHRGIAIFEYFGITRNDPLGLWRAICDLPAEESLVVLPRIYSVRWPTFSGKRLYQRGGISQASHVGDSEEFRSLRDYRPGDPIRAIHWRSWARTGRPVVKEYQEEYFARHALVLDTATAARNDEAFEATISIAASFAVAQPDADTLLDLLFVAVEFSQSTVGSASGSGAVKTITVGRGLGNTETLLSILAGVKPCAPETFQQLVRTVTAHAAVISSAILVFQYWDESRAQLVAALKAIGIGVRIYVPDNASRPATPAFPPEGYWVAPTQIREILAQAPIFF
ncbi:DUF58 domain-containing protein [Gammaproteobacteria bacterium]